MRIVDIKQGTRSWLEWRRKMVMASDAPIILGACKFKTIHKLYEEKTKGYETSPNHFMQRGLDLEPLALREFEKETGLILFSAVGQHDSIEWMGASFDGMTIEGDCILEVKCPGPKDHDLALQGQVPEKYLAQLYHQMEVAGLDFSFYFSFDGSKGKILEVRRHQEFIEKMIEQEFKFWQCLQAKQPPEPQPRRKRHATTTAGTVSGAN